MAEKAYLAVDMGASSGRHVLGLFDGQQLRLEEVYRFENGPVEVAGRLYWDLLGQWSHVRQGLRAAGGKCGERHRQRRRRYLGRRFRPARPRRRTAGQSLPLPRQPHQRHDGEGLRHRQPRGDLPPHRPAVHAVQHALPTAGDEALRLAAVGRGRVAADDARPVPLAADRREVQRDDRRQHEPVLQSGQGRLGDGTARQVFAADADSRPDRAAGHDAGAAAGERGRRDRLAGDQGGAARLARHGQRGDGRARPQPARRAARLVLHQPGHLGPDGHRVAAAGGQRRGAEAELHQRRRRGRHDPPVEEHHRAVAGAGVPPRVEPGRREPRLGGPQPA